MAKLPRRIYQWATAIHVANTETFPTVPHVLDTMDTLYNGLKSSEEDTTSMTTGGIHMTKDGDGDIEMWVDPSYLLGLLK